VNLFDPDGTVSVSFSAFLGLGFSVTVGRDSNGGFISGFVGAGFGGGFSLNPTGSFVLGKGDFCEPIPSGSFFGFIGSFETAGAGAGPIRANRTTIRGIKFANKTTGIGLQGGQFEKTSKGLPIKMKRELKFGGGAKEGFGIGVGGLF